MIGTLLRRVLVRENHHVVRIVRGVPSGPEDIGWDPNKGTIDEGRLRAVDAVVHLAGESISGRWSADKKRRIRESRITGTKTLAEALARTAPLPKVLVTASAIGYYGDAGDRVLDESAPAGNDFLAGVCRDWEAASRPAADAGIRVVNVRIGIVLSSVGGALEQMLPPFKAGVGGRLGNGKQFMSWVSHRDVVGVFHRALVDERLEGPVNAVAPTAVTNREFTKSLGRALQKPTLFPVPKLAIKTMFGEMGEALLLSSARVRPGKLEAVGYEYQDSDLDQTLVRLVRETEV